MTNNEPPDQLRILATSAKASVEKKSDQEYAVQRMEVVGVNRR